MIMIMIILHYHPPLPKRGIKEIISIMKGVMNVITMRTMIQDVHSVLLQSKIQQQHHPHPH